MSDKPIECGHCQKKPCITYKEVVGRLVLICQMCADCPILEKKLHGPQRDAQELLGTGSVCTNCLTSSDAIKRGEPLGCSNCYATFENLLYKELADANQMPSATLKPGESIHKGKSSSDVAPLIRQNNGLSLLNQALKDAIREENYEQAAVLRDQIAIFLKKGNA